MGEGGGGTSVDSTPHHHQHQHVQRQRLNCTKRRLLALSSLTWFHRSAGVALASSE